MGFSAEIQVPDAAPLDSAGPRPIHDSKRDGGWGWRPAVSLAAVGALAAVSVVGLAVRTRSDLDLGAVTFSGQQLLAWSSGQVAWHYDFGQPIRTLSVMTAEERVKIVDLNGDGHREVLVAAPQLLFRSGTASTDTDTLYCLTSRGRLMWKHEFRDLLSFGDEDCGPRWEVGSLLISLDGPRPAIWCSTCSFPMSGSVLFHFTTTGPAAPYFVNYGHMRALSEIRTPTGTYLLAGGINNEYNCAMLAVLREDAPSGHSPQTEPSKSACQGCPPGQPYRYFLFPRSEVNQVLGPSYNQISRILAGSEGVDAMTDELRADPTSGRLTGMDWVLYRFSTEFAPLRVTFSDQYWEDHERLSAEGRIKHTVEDCPERLKPITVRIWSPQAGWSSVELPPVAPHKAKP